MDAYLGLSSPEESEILPKEHYVTKLKIRLQFAYRFASDEAHKNSERNKTTYDLKVREATLQGGDRVLIRRMAFKGKHKLADRWDKDPYVVIGIPNKDIPVFKVRKESDESVIKTLHRNMLLPFSAIPGGASKVTDIPSKVKKTRPSTKSEKSEKQLLVHSSESEDNSDSDQDDQSYIVRRYIIPQRRKISSI